MLSKAAVLRQTAAQAKQARSAQTFKAFYAVRVRMSCYSMHLTQLHFFFEKTVRNMRAPPPESDEIEVPDNVSWHVVAESYQS
jgi:hypothetical protein